MNRLRNLIADYLLAPTIMLAALIRYAFRRPPFACVLACWLLSGTAIAQDGWRAGPGYPYGDDIRTVYDWLPEYVPRAGYWSLGWAIGPSGRYEQMRFWHPPTTVFSGRVTWQPQRRIYYSYTTGNTTVTGWRDADWAGFGHQSHH